ncbi:hypothetical protein V6N12_024249 [Hibiscus sabdariffa]|uniref:Uncharacterized protein n=1 Tax=Hibiscus sabdariffa TaxID=183260 RepID=A0ABR2G0Q6_9ROSI
MKIEGRPTVGDASAARKGVGNGCEGGGRSKEQRVNARGRVKLGTRRRRLRSMGPTTPTSTMSSLRIEAAIFACLVTDRYGGVEAPRMIGCGGRNQMEDALAAVQKEQSSNGGGQP